SPYLGTVTAAVSGVGTTSQTFLWYVQPFTLTKPADQTNTEGDSVSLPIVSSITGLTFSASGLPAGLSISSGGSISGTIAAGADYNNTVNVSATNGTVSTSISFDWTVNPVISITAIADQTATVGSAFPSLTATATASTGGTPTFTGDGLPSWLTI